MGYERSYARPRSHSESGTELDQHPYSQSSVHTPGGDGGGSADSKVKPRFDLVLELSSTPLSGTRGQEKTLPGSFDLWFQSVDIWLVLFTLKYHLTH